MANIDLKKPLWLAVIVTAVLLVVNYLMSFIGYPVKGLYSTIAPVSAVSGTLGNKVLGWIGGIIPVGDFMGMGIVAVFISAYLILITGEFLIGMGLPSASGRVGQLASKILWGTAVFYLLIVGLVMQEWGVWAGLLIHTIIVAYAAGFVADKAGVSM